MKRKNPIEKCVLCLGILGFGLGRIEKSLRVNRNVSRKWLIRAKIYNPAANVARRDLLASIGQRRRKAARFPQSLSQSQVSCITEKVKRRPLTKLEQSAKARAKYLASPEVHRAKARTSYLKIQSDPTRRAARKATIKAWRDTNKGKRQEYQKRYRPKMRAYIKRRMKMDPSFRITRRLRERLKEFLWEKTEAVGPSRLLFGCTPAFLKQHIESQLSNGMTWKNYGTHWHIDHIVPCAAFELTEKDQQRKCFHFSNLRPLSAGENMAKGGKVVECQPELLIHH